MLVCDSNFPSGVEDFVAKIMPRNCPQDGEFARKYYPGGGILTKETALTPPRGEYRKDLSHALSIDVFTQVQLNIKFLTFGGIVPPV